MDGESENIAVESIIVKAKKKKNKVSLTILTALELLAVLFLQGKFSL